jgi:hypothetical protein
MGQGGNKGGSGMMTTGTSLASGTPSRQLLLLVYGVPLMVWLLWRLAAEAGASIDYS